MHFQVVQGKGTQVFSPTLHSSKRASNIQQKKIIQRVKLLQRVRGFFPLDMGHPPMSDGFILFSCNLCGPVLTPYLLSRMRVGLFQHHF